MQHLRNTPNAEIDSWKFYLNFEVVFVNWVGINFDFFATRVSLLGLQCGY